MTVSTQSAPPLPLLASPPRTPTPPPPAPCCRLGAAPGRGAGKGARHAGRGQPHQRQRHHRFHRQDRQGLPHRPKCGHRQVVSGWQGSLPCHLPSLPSPSGLPGFAHRHRHTHPLLCGAPPLHPSSPHPRPSYPTRSCEIGDGVRLSNCVILNRVTIKNFARVADSIIGWSSKSERGRGGPDLPRAACRRTCAR